MMTNRFEAVLGDDDILCWEVIEWYITNEEKGTRVGRTLAKFYNADYAEFRAKQMATELQEEWDSIMEWENYMNLCCREEY